MQLLNVFVSILSLIQNFILLPNIHAIELGIKVEKREEYKPDKSQFDIETTFFFQVSSIAKS